MVEYQVKQLENMKYISKNNEKEVENLKYKFITAYIDQICNETDKLQELIDLSDGIAMNPVSSRLFSYLLIAMAHEDYLSVAKLKQEVINSVDFTD